MGYQKPTLSELTGRIKNNIFSRLPGADPSLQNSFLNVIALVFAGVLYGLYGMLAFVLRQMFPDQADNEYVDRWAGIFGLARTPATKSTGTMKFTGTNGSVVPLGAQVARSDGVLFSTLAAGTIASGEADISIACDVFGETGNTDALASFYLVETHTGIDNECILQTPGAVGGVERESDSSLKTNLVERMRRPPRGGSESDYEFWTKEVVPATRVWTRTFNENASLNPDSLLLGQVKIYFMIDGTGDGIPTTPQVDLVLVHLEEKAEPTARIIVEAPVADPIAFEINISPNTSATQTALNSALDDLILEEGSPGGTITHTKVLKTVSAVGSIDDFEVVTPVVDIVSAQGAIPIKGTVTIGTL